VTRNTLSISITFTFFYLSTPSHPAVKDIITNMVSKLPLGGGDEGGKLNPLFYTTGKHYDNGQGGDHDDSADA
jgi:hypothetical protein